MLFRSLKNGDFDDYSKLFIEIPFLGQRQGLHIQPRGRYLRAFHRGDWEKLPQCYQRIFDYAGEQGLVLSGFSYEMGINENVIDRMDDYIVQIEIPLED